MKSALFSNLRPDVDQINYTKTTIIKENIFFKNGIIKIIKG
jgi:hypothetical protein